MLQVVSGGLERERVHYYQILEQVQRGSLDITPWLVWFVDCLTRARDPGEGVRPRPQHQLPVSVPGISLPSRGEVRSGALMIIRLFHM